MKMYVVKITNMEKNTLWKNSSNQEKALICLSKQSDDQIKWFL